MAAPRPPRRGRARIVGSHPYPPALARVLRELAACSTLLAGSLKFDGTLIVQLAGEGPVRLIVVECTTALTLRATAQWDDERVLACRPGVAAGARGRSDRRSPCDHAGPAHAGRDDPGDRRARRGLGRRAGRALPHLLRAGRLAPRAGAAGRRGRRRAAAAPAGVRAHRRVDVAGCRRRSRRGRRLLARARRHQRRRALGLVRRPRPQGLPQRRAALRVLMLPGARRGRAAHRRTAGDRGRARRAGPRRGRVRVLRAPVPVRPPGGARAVHPPPVPPSTRH